MSSQREIRLSGFGGQGLITAGIILADAAIKEGKHAVQTQSYGPEARGGASRAEVIISDAAIDYPKVKEPDVLLAMSKEACDKYLCELQKDGILIVDSYYVKEVPETEAKVFSLPITELAREELGRVIVANIVALGATVQVTGVVGKEALEAAVLDRVPPGTEDLNRQALAIGFQLGCEQLAK
ncbi:MAG: 2-oxoacid:ferredoxin oxidoreductase subunit gamma [Firmicutes bacterium]|nr:2-oxoacid:ferredoxin oxidoreductase subunit gamma [Bacillota bacterium]